jgi:rhodanese-related sulfurtransferase
MKTLLTSLFIAIFATGSLFAQNPAAAGTVIKNVSPDEAEKALKERKDVVVLDVRTPEEFKAGHIAGAKNIDFKAPDFAKQASALDKSKTYIVHCGSGRRSTSSLDVFKEQKFSSILHLDKGFKAWEAAGKPVEK